MYHEDIFGVTLRIKDKQRNARRAQIFVTGADNKLTAIVLNGAELSTEAGKVNEKGPTNSAKSTDDISDLTKMEPVGGYGWNV